MKTWKKLSIYCSSFLFIFCIYQAIDYACGPEPDPYDYYVTFFHNNLPGNNNYRSFYYNGYLFLNDKEEQFNESDVNSAEWAAYLGNGVKVKDVKHAMYELDQSVDSALVMNNLSVKKRLPDSLQKNTFLRKLVSGKNNEALAYYRFCKIMQSNVSQQNHWLPEPKADSLALLKFGAEALKRAAQTHDQFLKLRYYYQSQRYYHYACRYDKAEEVYDKHIAAMHSDSHVLYWALSLKAGEVYWQGDKAKAAYLFSRAFEICPEKRTQIYMSYLFTHAGTRDIVKLARDDHEKAIIYAIEGFRIYPPDINSVKRVYEYDPHSPLVTDMLIREMNKVEESYLTPVLNKNIQHSYWDAIGYNSDDTSVRKYKAYVPVLKAFCQRLADENKCHDTGLGNLGVAYLDWMQQKNAEGLSTLARMDSLKINHRLADEKQLVKLLLLSQKITRLDTASEKELLPSLVWLDGKVKQEAYHLNKKNSYNSWIGYDGKFYSASSRDFYKLVLAQMYFKQKDTVKAALAILKSERTIVSIYGSNLLGYNLPEFWQQQMHSKYVRTILKWKQDTSRNAYDKLLLSGVNRTDMPDIEHLLGTAYLREHNYKEAVKVFSIINRKRLNTRPDNWDDKLFSNPFDIRIPDYPKVYIKDSLKSYTPLTFAKAMLMLQQKIKSDPKHASAYYFKLGAGLYNTSFYGNSWSFIAYGWESADIERKPTYYYDGDYLTCSNAEKYFLAAREHSKDAEFRAKCTFMAAKCKQKRIPAPGFDNYGLKEFDAAQNAYQKALRRNSYFADLKDHYAKTAYYQQALDECSYLRDFISARKPEKSKNLRVIVK